MSEVGKTKSARTSEILVRRKALTSAAATVLAMTLPALVPAAPAFAFDAPVLGATSGTGVHRLAMNEPVNDLLNVPLTAGAPLAAAGLTNSDSITVADNASAISSSDEEADISLVNTGDLKGGLGIDVSTGSVDLSDTLTDVSLSGTYIRGYRTVYDEFGNTTPTYFEYNGQQYYNGPQTIPTGELNFNQRTVELTPDTKMSRIEIDNSGTIEVAGSAGIKAYNPAGSGIIINNSGDISTTGETSRVGISASTEFKDIKEYVTSWTDGVFTYNANGQLTGVVEPYHYTFDINRTQMPYDGGSIEIHNSGTIDMGQQAAGYDAGPYGPVTGTIRGIFAAGDGGTLIENSGAIIVGDGAAGIMSQSTAETTVINSGTIRIGGGSAAITTGLSQGSAGDYRLGGEVSILNTGDILGGLTEAEGLEKGLTNFSSTGISVRALGSNNEYLDRRVELNARFAAANAELGQDYFQLSDVPNTKLYDTTVVNQGRIELKDRAVGISVVPYAGTSTVINEGTIIVGTGSSIPGYNVRRSSGGIQQNNFSVEGFGDTISINTASGVIVTGDDSHGMVNYNIAGSSTIINEGSITTGSGVSSLVRFGGYANPSGEDGYYDRLFSSYGIRSLSASHSPETLGYAHNSGSVTVGELAVGSFVSGQGYGLVNPYKISAHNLNDGVIETGDNASGMFTMGTVALTENNGSITTGDHDFSALAPHPKYTADEFEKLQYGIGTAGTLLSYASNNGTITVGDEMIGVSARTYSPGAGIIAGVMQSETGVIVAGDNSHGIRVASNLYGVVSNAGQVTTGANSVGVDVSAGSVVLPFGYAQATVSVGQIQVHNSGIIETGDNSVGVNMSAVLNSVPYQTSIFIRTDDPYPYAGYNKPYSGAVSAIGSVYFKNEGTIRVGAGSTAVAIAGEAVSGAPQTFINYGTIDAGTGTALKINTADLLQPVTVLAPGSTEDVDGYGGGGGGGGIILPSSATLGSVAISAAPTAAATPLAEPVIPAIDSTVVNVGTISGNIYFGDGNDTLSNTLYLSNTTGLPVSTGNIIMNGSTIDFGGGTNLLDMDQGMITIAGGNNVINGASVRMTNAVVTAVNGSAGSMLTINGDVSGTFQFAADISNSAADQLVINGDVASGSAIGVVLNPTEQLSGEADLSVISVTGENGASSTLLSGVTGQYADTLQSAAIEVDPVTGAVTVKAVAGMGHMASATTAATSLAQHWWAQAIGSFDKRQSDILTGTAEDGLSAWGLGFHQEGTMTPSNALQDVSFDETVSGVQMGITLGKSFGGGRFEFGPSFSYGMGRANMNAHLASARGKAWAWGARASIGLDAGFYLDAAWQQMKMDIDLATPETAQAATGTTKATGSGFNIEAGYAAKTKSGFSFVPQVQYSTVDVDLDDFSSSDSIYALTGIGGRASTLRAGLSVIRSFKTEHGSIAPMVSVSYVNGTTGESMLKSNGVAFATDSSGSGYRAEFGVNGTYKSWSLGLTAGVTDTTASGQALSTSLSLRFHW